MKSADATTRRAGITPIFILQKVADGVTVKEVDDDNKRSYCYLKNVLRAHYDRTGATGLSHALAQALRAGLIQ